MVYEFFLSLIFIFIILFTTQGYGFLLKKILFLKTTTFNTAEIGILGFFCLFAISIILHFFIPLSKFYNLIIVIIGISFYLINLKFNLKKNLTYLFPITFFLSFLSLSFEYHSDYFWYHLPYINLLEQYKIIFGASNLNDFFGYGHGWLDVLALFNFSIFDSYFLSFVSIIFVTYYIYFLIDSYLNSNDNIFKNLCTLCLIFFFLQYPLIKDYGAEIHLNLLYVIICLNIYLFFKNIKEKDHYFTIVILFTAFAFFLRLNSIIFIPLIFIFFLINFKFSLIYFQKNLKIFLFLIVTITLVVIKNIVISGCIAYPIYFTCFDNVSWGLGTSQAYERFQMLSSQSKGYLLYIVYEKGYETIYNFYEFAKSQNFISPKDYLSQNYNWFIYWFKYEHDKARIANIIVVLTLIITLSKLFYFKTINLIKNIKEIRKNILLITLFFYPIISYFYLLPQGRYGGFGIIFIFFGFLTCLLVKNNHQKNNYVILSFLFLSITYFSIKNFNNIYQSEYTSIYKSYPIYSKKNVDTKLFENNISLKFLLPETIGKPRYCDNISGLCTSKYRKDCIDEIIYKHRYILIKPNKKLCTKVIKDYFFF